MTARLPIGMTDAIRLTRAGDLMGATTAIQNLLGKGMPRAAPAPAPIPTGGPIIDLEAVAIPRQTTPRAASAMAVGQFTAMRHAGAAGDIAYRLYLPKGFAPGMPLIVMLHGCTQSPDDFARGTQMNELADELGFLVAYPEQTRRANQQGCWNWFDPANQQRDGREPSLIAGVTRDVIAAHQVDPARVYVAGLSAGGAAAMIMATVYPELLAAVGVHSGLAFAAAHDMPSAFAAMRSGAKAAVARDGRQMPAITFHGDGDATVHPRNGRQVHDSARHPATSTPTTERGTSQGGTAYTREVITDGAGRTVAEHWLIHGAGHAWSGGSAAGSYTDPKGPSASREMARFFLQHRLNR